MYGLQPNTLCLVLGERFLKLGIWFVWFSLLFSAVIGANAAESDSKTKPHVAFINPGYGDRGFWKDVRDTMQAAADQFGFELTVFDSDREWSLMAENANRVFAMDPPPDYIIAVNEHQQGTRIILEAQERGIPILMLLNDLTDEQKLKYGRAGNELSQWIGTLTPDNERAGFEIAQSLITALLKKNVKDLPDEICLLSLAGDSLTPASLQRLAGLDEALAKFPVLQEQRRLVVNWSFDEAYRRTADWIAKGGCLDAVWAANDDIALGAIKAIEEAGKIAGKDVFVGGLNWSVAGLQAVGDGKMTMTHGGHFLAGAWVMVLLKDYREGVELLKKHHNLTFGMQAVTPENLEIYKRLLGDRDWDRIDFLQFSLARKPEQGGYLFGIEGLNNIPWVQ